MRIWKNILRTLIWIYIKISFFLVRLIPYDAAVWLGGRVGAVVFHLLRRHRARAISNLESCFPGESKEKILKIAKQCFVNQGRNYLEFLCFPRLTERRIREIVSFSGLEKLESAVKEGKSVLYLMAHFGNWELHGASLWAYGHPVSAIAKRIYDERINSLIVELRALRGVKTILRGESPMDILKAMKDKKPLCVLLDQATGRVRGVSVDFFGRKARTPSGFAMIAARKNAVVLCGFIVREGSKHRVYIEGPLEVARSEDREKEILQNTRMFTKVIEEWVRKYPDHWVWMHDRWRQDL